MKKKLAILVFAGVMLFSGLNAFAATDICPHPTVTTVHYEERKFVMNCYEHHECKIYHYWLVKSKACLRCFEEFTTEKEDLGYRHIR